MGYWKFLRQNWRFVGFGFTLTFFSGYGQTFFVSLFGAQIREEFALTHGQFGTAYSAATLASALSLIWLGRIIDQIDLRYFVTAVCVGMMAATMAMTFASGLVILLIAFYGLRLTGQGLMIHAAHTSMARYFAGSRGRAIALVQTGQPIGEGLFPSLAVAVMALVGWRATWALSSASVLLIALPLVFLLLKGHTERHRTHLANTKAATANGGTPIRHWTRAEVMRDPRFYAILVPLASFPFMGTGLFFHQVHVAESQGWTLPWLAAMFTLYAASTIPSALVSGALVDRFGAIRVLPFAPLPLIFALIALVLFDGPMVAVPYMAFFGAAIGFQSPIANALIVELYGSAHLGAIRAVMTSVMVFASAPSPALVGWTFDAGASVELIAGCFIAYLIVATGVALVTARRHQRQPA